ncbi:hypothetical protein V3G39_04925 [Dermatophilaceae bacterium Sec6.4]
MGSSQGAKLSGLDSGGLTLRPVERISQRQESEFVLVQQQYWVLKCVIGGIFLSTLVACSGGVETSSSPLVDVAKRTPAPTSITLGEIYGAGWDRAVVGCSHGTGAAMKARLGFNWADAADASNVGEDQQLIVLAKGSSVTKAEKIFRSSVDLCGGQQSFPVVIKPGTKLQLVVSKWSDGSDFLVAKY